ncbi:putative RNA helicase [Helianthus annuus]|nr:putative RNA helicase [Helianthus annuus]
MSGVDFLTKFMPRLDEFEAACMEDSDAETEDELKKKNDFYIEVEENEEDSHRIQAGFEALNLSPGLMKALYEDMKFVRPSKIQSMCLPKILTPPYQNLIAQAPTCSGKTTCFLLGILSRVDPTLPAPQALCICPTRELASANMEVLLNMGKFTGITSDLCLPVGSVISDCYVPPSERAPLTAQVIIGSPGTVDQMIAANKLSISDLKILVFEEVDFMLAAYKHVAVRIIEEVDRRNPKCQVQLFSATFSDAVKDFVSTLENDVFVPEFRQLFVKKQKLSLGSVKQYKVNVDDELSKIMVIKDKILELGDGVWQAIIFVRAIKGVEMLHEALVNDGYAVATVKGSLSYKEQEKLIKEFKYGSTRILISAGFLAPGFDHSLVNLVVNYDLPVLTCNSTQPDYQSYLRRIGRAGRFGRKGAVFNLLCGAEDNRMMEKIEKRFTLGVTEVPSWTSDDDIKDTLKKAGLMDVSIANSG